MRYLFILLLLCSSCVTSQKVTKYLEEHPEEFAELCADEFPVKEKLVTGKTITVTDTVEVAGPELDCPPVTNQQGQTITNKVKCPDVQTLYKTVYRTDTLIVENTAHIKALEARSSTQAAENAKLQEKLTETQGKARRRGWWLAGIGVAGALAVAWKFRRLLGVPV